MALFITMLMTLVFVACPTIGCDRILAQFSIKVIPEWMDDTIPDQRCVFLVAVEEEGEEVCAGKTVNISATASNSEVTVHPEAITPGQVAEVTVIPNETSVDTTLTVTISGERCGLRKTESATIVVRESVPSTGVYATELRERFIPWLAEEYPEFGITSETEWVGTVVRPHIDIVGYYLFFSEDWEMGLRWHVMVPPHDWAEIYLRHRTTELSPTHGFKISSLDANEEPHAVQPEESVWR